MAENSEISWTDHTFNPWMGCTKVSPACTNCYAERDFDHRYKNVKWGPQGTRVVTSDANWRKPIKWNREAGDYGQRKRVFCASLADVFEDWKGPVLDHKLQSLWVNESGSWVTDDGLPGFAYRKQHVTMDDVRRRLFALIDATPNLDWLLLTKRPEKVLLMWPNYELGRWDSAGRSLPLSHFRKNVWLGTSVENQDQADKRMPKLLKCRYLSPVLFLSCEPLIGPVDLLNVWNEVGTAKGGIPVFGLIDWVIAGGESGPNARPSNPDWFGSIREQCESAGVPFHFKQWGEWAPYDERILKQCSRANFHAFDEDCTVFRVGKKSAGRMLDGRIHDAFPEVSNG